MSKTVIDQFLQDPEQLRYYQQEQLLLQVTEHMCKIMNEEEITRSQLADLLGKSKGRISQILDGEKNLTLRTIANVFTALGRRAVFQTEPIETKQASMQWLSSCFEQSAITEAHWDFSQVGDGRIEDPALAV